jgi:hypothetical protein
MSHRTIVSGSFIVVIALSSTLLALAGCSASRTTPGTEDGGGLPLDSSIPSSEGVPCDVSAILRANCWSCHAGTYAPSLVTYADLTAPSAAVPGSTVLDRAIARMGATTSPMPPAPAAPVSAANIAIMQTWATAGAPATSCAVDAGAPPPPADGGPDPYATPTTCSSGTNWTFGTIRSPNMEPGRACIACHSVSRGPGFDVAGTVYATAHEPDDCNGANAGGAVVVITDVNGAVWRLSPNSVGNFSARRTGMVKPYTARVEYGGRTRAMIAPQMNGDCNACHTLAGTAVPAGTTPAPGRIMLP